MPNIPPWLDHLAVGIAIVIMGAVVLAGNWAMNRFCMWTTQKTVDSDSMGPTDAHPCAGCYVRKLKMCPGEESIRAVP